MQIVSQATEHGRLFCTYAAARAYVIGDKGATHGCEPSGKSQTFYKSTRVNGQPCWAFATVTLRASGYWEVSYWMVDPDPPTMIGSLPFIGWIGGDSCGR